MLETQQQTIELNLHWHESANEPCYIFTVLLRRTEDEARVEWYDFEHQRSNVIDIQALLLRSVLPQITTSITHDLIILHQYYHRNSMYHCCILCVTNTDYFNQLTSN